MRLPEKQSNIMATLDLADDTDIQEGRVAYFRYNEVMGRIAEYYGYTLPEVAAVFAATSPNSDYSSNLRSCVSIIKGHKEGVPVENIKIGTYLHCRDRAYGYLTGTSFLETVKGKKIRSFYRNICNPLDPAPVTIDGHAVNIWGKTYYTLREVVRVRFKYEEVAADYRELAARVSILPNQLQAITWFTWKRVNNIIAASRQLELFEDISADIWKTLRNPEDIPPYPYLVAPSYTTLRPKKTA